MDRVAKFFSKLGNGGDLYVAELGRGLPNQPRPRAERGIRVTLCRSELKPGRWLRVNLGSFAGLHDA